jgi:hypothetical protein
MKSTILIFVIVLSAGSYVYSQTAGASRYIGYKYKGVLPSKTLPNGVKDMGGSLIGDIDDDPVYEIASVEKGKTKMLWLNESTGKDSTGVTGWKVLDVLSFGGLTKSDYLFFYGDPAIGCTRSGKDIPNVVGVGRIIRKQGIFRPSKLWVADLATKKFKSLSVSGIKCEYSEP